MRGADVRRGAQGWWYLPLLALAACGQTDVLGTIAPEQPTVSPPQAGAAAPTAGDDAEPAREPPAGDPIGTSAPGCERAASVFARALCACGSVSTLGDLRTVRVADADAPARAGGADVGILGGLQSAAFVGPIDGDLTIAGAGLSALVASEGLVTGALRVSGDLALSGTAMVEGDAWLRGRLLGDGRLVAQRDVYRGPLIPVAPPAPPSATLEVAGEVVTQAFTLDPPCACDAEPAVDVAAIVALAAVDNDNAATGFSPDALGGADDGQVHELPPGRLFVHAVSARGDVVLRVTGQSALFVGGDLQVGGALRAELSADAELELWIARDVAVAGPIALGALEHADAARMYVGGVALGGVELPAPGPEIAEQIPVPPPAAGAVATPDDTWTVNLYAPQLDLGLARDTTVTGSLFVRSIVSVGDLHVRHDPRVVERRSFCGD
jgi:hypothetical protein